MTLRLQLVDALKRALKAQGLTYANLAERIGMSEASVKRMFSEQSIRLERLEQICEALDMGLAELAAEAEQRRPALAELSGAQEQALVDDPLLMLALYLAVNRWTQDEVLAAYQISLPEWTARMVKLDRLGIIELLPGNRARVLTARNFRWRTDGPMQRFFQQRLLPEFFKSRFAASEETLLLLSGMVSRRSAATIREKLREAASQFDLMLAQDAHLPASERVGVSLVLAQRPWSLGLFDPLRKASSSAGPTG
jgi:DNA-binding Xre family transcriptional regulator